MKVKDNICTLALAALLAAFHVLVVVRLLFETGGHGERQAFIVLILDMPLVLVWDLIGGDRAHAATYVWFFSIAGTLMYAAAGGLIGQAMDRLRRWLRNK